ncbi:hypothetical protein HLH34_04380 [Gluconacetobacter azotocaptans]|uniref:Uncharacterized protein n=1 Tax=Gluconacetobacter azotocaptans TaxID=142834 RepID=A0A7W4JQR8_9PROT|nr:hypothetical protein [Gluconacetobacter azotocaptans]MBB2189201.1 hypothetical protein [Gluconacetobacter azotocaptans]GBQ32237.1 hypothetical protein AA13594_2309 [Gluconacetobacter azotocaptans DSM 13594]
MALDLRVSLDKGSLQNDLAKLSQGEIRTATAFAMNMLAANGKRAVVDRMKEVFDRPNHFTLDGFFVRPATADNLTAWVASKDFAPNGTPAIKYLGPQIHGGARDMKRSEKALARISGGQYWLPGPGAPLDQYGNIRPGEMTRILSRLGLMADASSNMTDKTARRLARQGKAAKAQRSEYFVARERGNGRPKGIYKLMGPGKVSAVLIFTPRAPTYRMRLPVEQIVQQAFNARQDRVVAAALRRVLRQRGL